MTILKKRESLLPCGSCQRGCGSRWGQRMALKKLIRTAPSVAEQW
ncbi:hypothetical protein [Streptomyces nodosus]